MQSASISNDQFLIRSIIDQKRKELEFQLNEHEFFEIFVAEQILKNFDLSPDELEIGHVGSSLDGGIDGLYLFVNGTLAQEDFDINNLKKGVLVEVFIIQAKYTKTFKQDTIDKLIAATEDIFDLSKDLSRLTNVYNETLISIIKNFHRIYEGLANRYPSLEIKYVYSSLGSELSIHDNVKRKSEILCGKVKELFSHAKIDFVFLGASKLLELARRSPTTAHELSLAESPISSSGEIGYICLVKLREFYKFIREDINGKIELRKNIFESNVRDYQGDVRVNEEISSSLRESGEDFWWLNNGVTIIAAKATLNGKKLNLEDPQIVNGLQTSTEIFKYFSSSNTEVDERNLLIRVIVPDKPESRFRIIKATNSQTAIPGASLRATDKIQRDIEEYLQPHRLYYDRRKNFYKNEGKPIERIISIPLMAQAVMAILLQRPNDARARPSTLVSKEEEYNKIFSYAYPLNIYLVCINIIKKVETYLRNCLGVEAKDRNNLRFYLAMYVGMVLTGKINPTANELAELNIDEINEQLLEDGFNIIKREYSELGEGDQVAKDSELSQIIKDSVCFVD